MPYNPGMLTISHPASPETYYGKEGLAHEGGFRLPVAGKLADLLGLSGIVSREVMGLLFSNKTPDGEKLTQRDRFDRRKCSDYCFSPPKSVSIMHQVAGDDRIAEAVSEAASAVMKKLAADLVVRPKGRREAADVMWFPEFHLLARPEQGKSDPQDHVHFVVPNAGQASDGKRYAIDNAEVAHDSKYYRFRLQHELATRLHGLGYDLRQTRNGFEIQGVSDSMIRTFSRRGGKVDAEAERREIKSPKAKAALAAYTREKKRPYHADKAREEWLERLTPRQAASLSDLYGKALQRTGRSLPEQASPLPEILPGMLERESCVREKDLLEQAWRVNPLWSPEYKGLLTLTDRGEKYLTTAANLEKEREMIEGAKGSAHYAGTPPLIANSWRTHPDHSATGGGVKIIRTKRISSEQKDISSADKLTFAEVHRLATSGQPVTLIAPPRDYRKPQRGNPLVALEDIGGLSTGQPTIPRLVGRVTQKARDIVERLKYILAPEREAEHGRSAGREAAR